MGRRTTEPQRVITMNRGQARRVPWWIVTTWVDGIWLALMSVRSMMTLIER